jgi:hypothetical protein
MPCPSRPVFLAIYPSYLQEPRSGIKLAEIGKIKAHPYCPKRFGQRYSSETLQQSHFHKAGTVQGLSPEILATL